MAKKSERITRAELSRRLKISRSYVSQLTNKGVFKIGKDKKLDFADAKQDYKNFIDPNYVDDNKSDKSKTGFAASRANTEHYKSEMARLDFEERQGELLPVAVVQKQQFEAARACRDALLSIPGRLGPELVGLETRKEIETLLTEAIIEALERLSRE